MRLCNHHKLNTGTERNGTEPKKDRYLCNKLVLMRLCHHRKLNRNRTEPKKRLISLQEIGAHETLCHQHKLNTKGTERNGTNGMERNGTEKRLISLQ